MLDILNKFVASKFEPREELRSPFLPGDYIYATDSCIAIRIPKFDGADFQVCDEKFPKLESLFSDNYRDEFVPLPALPKQIICGTCNGSGTEMDEEDGELMGCFSCSGNGHQLEIIDVGITKFKNYYLQKIACLPGLRFAPHPTDVAAPAYFFFDG